jgi:hypothetical protein
MFVIRSHYRELRVRFARFDLRSTPVNIYVFQSRLDSHEKRTTQLSTFL